MAKYLLPIVIIMILLLNCRQTQANEQIQKLFKEGNEAYKSGNYTKAIESYLQLISLHGLASPQVFYNLGNAYFKEYRIGYAILYYEKANKLLPRDRDITFNLNYVREVASREMGTSLSGSSLSFLKLFTINELTIIVAVLYFAFTALLILYVFFKKEKYLLILCVSGLLFFIGLIALSMGIYESEYTQHAIVVVPSAELRTGPNLAENISCIVPEGSKVKILRKEEGWREVIVPGKISRENPSSGQIQGWIPEKDLMNI